MKSLRAFYGAGPSHVVALLIFLAFAVGAVSIVVGDPSLLRIAVWFVAGAIVHDLVLLPAYTAVDLALGSVTRKPRRVPVVNHVRVPLLGAGLTFLVFLPGIIQQGDPVVIGQTGLDQSPFLGRWLLLVAAMAVISAVVYVVRLLRARGRHAAGTAPAAPAPDSPQPVLQDAQRLES